MYKNYQKFLEFLRGAGYTGQVNKALYDYLVSQGIAESQLNEMLFKFLRGLGYTGTLNKMLSEWSATDYDVPGGFDPGSAALLEIGDIILLESGDKLLLE